MTAMQRRKGKAGDTAATRGSAKRKASLISAGRKPKAETGDAKPADPYKRLMASLAANGPMGNAITMVNFATATFGADLSLVDATMVLREMADVVHNGDLSPAELMLIAQASALNAIFCEMARRAALNICDVEAADRYMRLALQAQDQCRSTWEALVAIKKPPTPLAAPEAIHAGAKHG